MAHCLTENLPDTRVILELIKLGVLPRREEGLKLVLHSDQGSQYTSAERIEFALAHNITLSHAKRSSHGNQVADSFHRNRKHSLRLLALSDQNRTDTKSSLERITKILPFAKLASLLNLAVERSNSKPHTSINTVGLSPFKGEDTLNISNREQEPKQPTVEKVGQPPAPDPRHVVQTEVRSRKQWQLSPSSLPPLSLSAIHSGYSAPPLFAYDYRLAHEFALRASNGNSREALEIQKCRVEVVQKFAGSWEQFFLSWRTEQTASANKHSEQLAQIKRKERRVE